MPSNSELEYKNYLKSDPSKWVVGCHHKFLDDKRYKDVLTGKIYRCEGKRHRRV